MNILKNLSDLSFLVKTQRLQAGPGGRKMTAQQLADKSGVSRDTIFRIERAEDVSFGTAMKVLRVLGLGLKASTLEWPDLSNAHVYFRVEEADK